MSSKKRLNPEEFAKQENSKPAYTKPLNMNPQMAAFYENYSGKNPMTTFNNELSQDSSAAVPEQKAEPEKPMEETNKTLNEDIKKDSTETVNESSNAESAAEARTPSSTTPEKVKDKEKTQTTGKGKNQRKKNLEELERLCEDGARKNCTIKLNSKLLSLLVMYKTHPSSPDNLSDIITTALYEHLSKEEIYNQPWFQLMLNSLSEF